MPTDEAASERRPDPVDLAVGGRIRLRRRMLSISQEKLAEALGLTFQQVQKYERGANRVSASKLVAIAKTLDTTVAELVGEDPASQGRAGSTAEVIGKLWTTGAVELLSVYKRLSPEQRFALLRVGRAMTPPDELPGAEAVLTLVPERRVG